MCFSFSLLHHTVTHHSLWFSWVVITYAEFCNRWSLLSFGINSTLSSSALISTLLHWHGQRQRESPGSVHLIITVIRLPKEGTTLNGTGTWVQTSVLLMSREGVLTVKKRGSDLRSPMNIALTLPLDPSIVFQLIAASLQQIALTDGKVFVWVHRGVRLIVLTGGEKWILGPNDTRPRAKSLRQISKCWSIQSARNQEIR